MADPLLPQIPYGEVRSTFIGDELRGGAFEDLAHRIYVNHLIFVEWYVLDRPSISLSGLDTAGMSMVNWRIATKYPEAFDAVRREHRATTSHERTWGGSGDEDPVARKSWAERHRNEWRVVCSDAVPAGAARTDPEAIAERPRFAPFRFPKLPYDRLRSEFVREELRCGSFDDLEHSRYVNKLVYIEAWARDRHRFHTGGYPPIKPWILFSQLPTEYDIIHREFGEPTRADLEIWGNSLPDEADAETTCRYKRAWQSVAEGRST